MDFLFSILLGLIEGITEFLPISSTGHLLVASGLFSYAALNLFKQPTFLSTPGVRLTFDIVIQIGPILAIILYFRRDLWELLRALPREPKARRLLLNLVLAFIPAGVVGILIGKLFGDSATVIGLALLIGGIVFLLVEAKPREATITDLYEITPVQALIIGVAQITALIPGVSRSGATIVAGLLIGIRRDVITKFTFYLAIPTLTIATGYALYKAQKAGELTTSNFGLIAIGTAVAFVSAYAAVAWFLRYVSTRSFRGFGFYRIAIGVIILILALATPLLSS